MYIHLTDIPTTLEPGTPIPCTVDGVPHKARYVGPASMMWTIWVEIDNIQETANGLTTQLSMFGPTTFRDEFVVNPDRTGGNVYE